MQANVLGHVLSFPREHVVSISYFPLELKSEYYLMQGVKVSLRMYMILVRDVYKSYNIYLVEISNVI